MSKALLQTANTNAQTVAENGIISPGNILRRYGCNCRLNGNAIEVDGSGYYALSGTVTLAPTAAGDVTIALFKNGVAIPGATATSSVAAAGDNVTLPIDTTIREGCCCDGASQVTCVLTAGTSTVTNYSLRVEKK